MKRKLLVLDNDDKSLEELHGIFAGSDVALLQTTDVRSALACAQADHPDVALIDIGVSGGRGLGILKTLREKYPRIGVIVMSGQGTTEDAIDAMTQGAFDYLTKPLDGRLVKSVVERALQNSMLGREVRIIGTEAEGAVEENTADVMIGASPEVIEIWKMVGTLSASDATVLIQGESGTGKELLARSIYHHSRRRDKPFLTVNCAALPETLLESELFGHEKGAFTDAFARRIGRFEQAAGGTIFLDEIAEMSMKSQAKLLRVLENREFSRVGGTETLTADVRVIAATNRSLIASVKEKSFRVDLYYRLKVVTIHLPPLRERIEDIPLLAGLFVRQIAREQQQPAVRIVPQAMGLLRTHPWEGNVRELKNVLKTAVVFCKGGTLLPEDLAPLLGEPGPSGEPPPAAPGAPDRKLFQPLFETVAGSHAGAVYRKFISEAEKALISLAMDRHRQNEVHAARFLGISRNTLRQRLKTHGIK